MWDLRGAVAAMKDAFGRRLSLAISRLYGPGDGAILGRIESLGRACGVPLLATNQVHYHDERRRTLQDVLTCIRHGCTIQQAGFRLFPNGERFIKSPGEMHRLFGDFPAALQRTVEVAEQCAFSLDELRYEYPDEIVPPGKTPASYLADLAWDGAAGRYPRGIPEKVSRQIAHELALIEQLKIEPYFLTVYDLVRFGAGRAFFARAAVRRRIRRSAIAWASPPSIPTGLTCFSSVLSVPCATSRRTSTLISSTSGARKCSNISTRNTAASAPA